MVQIKLKDDQPRSWSKTRVGNNQWVYFEKHWLNYDDSLYTVLKDHDSLEFRNAPVVVQAPEPVVEKEVSAPVKAKPAKKEVVPEPVVEPVVEPTVEETEADAVVEE